MTRQFRQLGVVIYPVGILVLVGTWYLLYLWLMAMTEGWLVPWDTWSEPIRPPVGTPTRTINDFFESGFGSYLPAVVVVTASVGLFLCKVAFSKTNGLLLPWLFAGFNFIFFLGSLVSAFVGWRLTDLWLPQPRPDIDVGYHRTWPMIAMTMILVAFLLIIQAKVNLDWRRLSSIQRGGLLTLFGLVSVGIGWFFAARLLLIVS